ncbi:tetratricopeptide repeat protein [Azospirillum sp.]|uniref:tetratricopeptide repeat protein n=1 Tax=Azospirillum sp. TaxID=34012 RepID=UPI002D583CF8|nr:tetratricopeptide repeat protein [Azospirillum sp.]HYD66561.1 tetratricopeptide repeat protein [Azospirillum sp.]
MNRQQRRARDKAARPPVCPPAPPEGDAVFAQALQLHQAGRLTEAEGLYRRVLDAAPDHAGALHYLGVVAFQAGHLEPAVALIGRSLAVAPDQPDALGNLGTALHGLGRLEEAEAALARAVEIQPAYAQGWYNLGAVRRAAGRLEPAAAAFRRAVDLRPDHADALNNLGGVLQVMERPEEAEPYLEQALALRPGDADTLSNLAAVREALGRPDEAIDTYRQLLAARPDAAEIHYNLANALRAVGARAGAEAGFRRAVELAPDHAGARWNLGLLRLERAGPDAEAWEQYGWRLKSPDIQASRRMALPEWQGEDLAGKRALVWREQGLGDELMFASLYPDLIRRAGHVVIECDRRLVPLFARSFPGAAVRAETGDPAPMDLGTDCHIPAGSLPRWLRPGLAAFPDAPGFLVPDASRADRWRRELAALGAGPKVGLAWRSGLTTRRRAPAYTRLDQWAPVLTVPGLVLVPLQYDRCALALTDAEARFGVTLHRWPGLDLKDDLEETAALIAALDLVISAPTAVAELAGALGVPTWRLAPGGDWSALGTAARPWFPAQRPFQPRPGEGMAGVLARLGAELASLGDGAPLLP